MANPIQQGLKHPPPLDLDLPAYDAAMANPIQQGLKHPVVWVFVAGFNLPQWLIQYNKD